YYQTTANMGTGSWIDVWRRPSLPLHHSTEQRGYRTTIGCIQWCCQVAVQLLMAVCKGET
ncbi:MAG: hypothetical protein AAFS10_05215, partial [Myxococcota bacterium]